MLKNEIRALALCIIKDNDRVLVGEGFDPVKNETFYRFLGGGIEFGEKAEEAIRREIQEELGTDLEDLKYLTSLENIFTYNGGNGHEIISVFSGSPVNKEIYQKDNIDVLDSKEGGKAVWKKIEDFKNKKLILYPEGTLPFI